MGGGYGGGGGGCYGGGTGRFSTKLCFHGKKREHSVVVAIGPILVFVEDLDNRAVPFGWDSSRYPNIDWDVVKSMDDPGVNEC